MMFEKQALVIGNDEYESSPLPSCVYDAQQTTKSLRSIGFRVTMETDLRSEQMLSIIDRFARSIRPGAVVLFYYSGHGGQYDGKNLLLPIDYSGIDCPDAQSLIEQMHRNRPRAVIAILDCCRTYIPHPNAPRKSLGTDATARIRPGLAPMGGPPSTIIGFGCPAEASSMILAGYKNSLYTHYFIRRIRTPNVDVEALLKNVAVDVQQASTNRQLPFLYSNCHERIYLNTQLWPNPAQFNPALMASDQHRRARKQHATSSYHGVHHHSRRNPWLGVWMHYPHQYRWH